MVNLDNANITPAGQTLNVGDSWTEYGAVSTLDGFTTAKTNAYLEYFDGSNWNLCTTITAIKTTSTNSQAVGIQYPTPNPTTTPRCTFNCQVGSAGTHSLRIRFYGGKGVTGEKIVTFTIIGVALDKPTKNLLRLHHRKNARWKL